MKVLSLFDGIGGARQALKELNIDCDYYASEIDKYAMQVAKANHSDIKHIGDIKLINKGFNEFDLLIGGSPCQDLSIAKKDRKGLKGDRSSLFYEYLRILNETKPKYFILENVASMGKESQEIITKELFNIEPIIINSALLTAQNRKRLYWVGELVDGGYKQVKIDQPKDQEIYLKDIIEGGVVNVAIATQLGNSKNWGNAINKTGKAFTLRASQPNGVMIPIRIGQFNKVNYEIVKKSYQKRVNKISNEFNKYLKESRGNFTYKQIATKLDLPLSQVEHYFRTDKSRAVPNVENYKKIKELLSLNDKWDNMVMDFETKQSTYEQNLRLYNINGKSPTLTLNCNVPINLSEKPLRLNGSQKIDDKNYFIRKLTPTECCRLQGFPDDYVSMVSNTQGYKGLGNSFTVPVIKHILKILKS